MEESQRKQADLAEKKTTQAKVDQERRHREVGSFYKIYQICFILSLLSCDYMLCHIIINIRLALSTQI